MDTRAAPAAPGTLSGETLDPADWQSFRAQGHRMLDDIIDYLEHIRERPVWQPIPEGVRGCFRRPVPTAPTDALAPIPAPARRTTAKRVAASQSESASAVAVAEPDTGHDSEDWVD